MANITFYRTDQENEIGMYIFYMQIKDTIPRPMMMSVSTFNILQTMLTINRDTINVVQVDPANQSLASAKAQFINNS